MASPEAIGVHLVYTEGNDITPLHVYTAINVQRGMPLHRLEQVVETYSWSMHLFCLVVMDTLVGHQVIIAEGSYILSDSDSEGVGVTSEGEGNYMHGDPVKGRK